MTCGSKPAKRIPASAKLAVMKVTQNHLRNGTEIMTQSGTGSFRPAEVVLTRKDVAPIAKMAAQAKSLVVTESAEA